MKKSTFLSLATAGAIVATSVGTFAAWDTMSATGKGSVRIDKPVTMTFEDFGELTKTREAGVLDENNAPSYTKDVQFAVSEVPSEAETKYNLVVTSKVYNKGTEIEATGISSEVSKAVSDENTSINGDHTYKVTVTPDSNSISTEYDVEITAKIVEKQP